MKYRAKQGVCIIFGAIIGGIIASLRWACAWWGILASRENAFGFLWVGAITASIIFAIFSFVVFASVLEE